MSQTGVTKKLTVPEMLPLVQAYYALPGNEAGGSLHIVLDDGNVHDHNVKFCLDQAIQKGDQLGMVIATLLLTMSRTQRLRLARMR